MTSTALEVIKFRVDLRPQIGLSTADGTDGCLRSVYSNFPLLEGDSVSLADLWNGDRVGEPGSSKIPKSRPVRFTTFPAPTGRVDPVQPVEKERCAIILFQFSSVSQIPKSIPNVDPMYILSGSCFERNIFSFGGETYSLGTRL